MRLTRQELARLDALPLPTAPPPPLPGLPAPTPLAALVRYRRQRLAR